MPKALHFAMLFAALSLPSVTCASASQIGVKHYGNVNHTRATDHDLDLFASFRIEGDANDLVAAASPRSRHRSSQTVMNGSDQYILEGGNIRQAGHIGIRVGPIRAEVN